MNQRSSNSVVSMWYNMSGSCINILLRFIDFKILLRLQMNNLRSQSNSLKNCNRAWNVHWRWNNKWYNPFDEIKLNRNARKLSMSTNNDGIQTIMCY